ncbi:MAG: DNA-directed RNA polymerase subunit RPC12/RpoP [Zhongshania marina]|jgi:DNA-directed RNA polymerase subunit RPC12/RpoP
MLVEKYESWLSRVRADQVPLLEYACPDCSQKLQTLEPPEGEKPWDSCARCPYCEGQHFKVAHSHGEVEVRRLQS